MLKGDLRTMPLAEVLQWVAAGRKTGTLHVRRGPVDKRILLKDGALFSSWSNDPREQLGQFLLRLRLISEERLFRALSAQEERGQLLGAILLQDGVLSEDELRRALRTKAEEMVYDLFLWPSGDFEFREGELAGNILITFESAVTPVIMEGIRRLDEWHRIREVFPDQQTRFRPAQPQPAPATPLESEVVALAAAGKDLAEMGLELRRSEFDTAALVFDLCSRGLLAVDAAPRPSPAAPVYPEAEAVEPGAVPSLAVDLATLTHQRLDPQEGFVLSRVNGEWDVQSILRVCPLSEQQTLVIFSRLLQRGLIRLG